MADVLRGSKRDSVNLTLYAFFHRKFSAVYIMVPGGGSKSGSVNLCFGRQGEGLREVRGAAQHSNPLCPAIYCILSLSVSHFPFQWSYSFQREVSMTCARVKTYMIVGECEPRGVRSPIVLV